MFDKFITCFVTLIILIWYCCKCLYYLAIYAYCLKVCFVYGKGNVDFDMNSYIFLFTRWGWFRVLNKIPPNLNMFMSPKGFVARRAKLMLVLEKCVEDRSKFEHTVGPESPSHGYNLYYVRLQCSRELYKMKERDLHAVHLEIITAYRTLKIIIEKNVLYEVS
jgi:hypothetical protein